MKTDVVQIEDLALKICYFELKGDFMQQHVHKFDHTHTVIRGTVRVICDGQPDEYHDAGSIIFIGAMKSHKLIAETDDAASMCIHTLEPDEMGNFDFNSVTV